MRDSETRKTETQRIKETYKPGVFKEPETLEIEETRNLKNFGILKPEKLQPRELKKPINLEYLGNLKPTKLKKTGTWRI